VRRRASTTTYAGLSYLVAALACWAAVAARHVPVVGLPARAYEAAVLMALGPQLIGHTAMNWALKRLAAGPVAVVITAEPVAASLMAWAWFGEVPPLGMLLAIPLTFLGIQLATAGAPVPGEPSPGAPDPV
jgi:drug/metabolite transporter (DMT)-like permease